MTCEESAKHWSGQESRAYLVKHCIHQMLIEPSVLKNSKHSSSSATGVRAANHIGSEICCWLRSSKRNDNCERTRHKSREFAICIIPGFRLLVQSPGSTGGFEVSTRPERLSE